MDIVEAGYRCTACSGAATIQQHLEEREEKIRSHNRAIAAGAGLEFWRLEFRCSECGDKLAKGPRVWQLQVPPLQFICAKCGASFAGSLLHRANWMFSLLAKIGFVLALLASFRGIITALSAGEGIDAVVAVFLAAFYAVLGAMVLAIPAVLVADFLRKRSPSGR
jgi:DNA-directed RNA polymerase subunit RPC12/RpoP